MFSQMNLSAVIPSAGFSSRMHQYKPLLKFGDKRMVEVVIQLFQGVGINDIIVVTGHNHDVLEPVARIAGARVTYNPNYDAGMFSSIQKGVKQISKNSRGFFLLPVDIPVIRPSTIQSLIAAFEQNPNHIVIPQFKSRNGHPPLIPVRLIKKITDMDSRSNLKKVMKKHNNDKIYHQIHDRGILLDADTKDAYHALLKKYSRITIPDEQECRSILDSSLAGEDAIKMHAEKVFKISKAFINSIQSKGPILYSDLNLHLVVAGALLHDIKRKEKHHARAGAQYVFSLGFPKLADIVAQHMDLKMPIPQELTESQVVYFADKLCIGSRLTLDYADRFKKKIIQFPKAKEKIYRRYKHARNIQTKIELASGRSIRAILNQEFSKTMAKDYRKYAKAV